MSPVMLYTSLSLIHISPDERLTSLVVYRAWELGLLIYDTGLYSNVLEFTPPLIITEEDVDQAVNILEQALCDALEGKITEEKLADYAGWNSCCLLYTSHQSGACQSVFALRVR